MRYLGGKKRQAPAIVATVKKLRPNFHTYVEPFCGGMWSATAVIAAFGRRDYVLSDINPYLMCFWRAAVFDGFMPPARGTESQYLDIKRRMVLEPITGYAGFAWSFAGKFMGTPARCRTRGFIPSWCDTNATTVRKIETLRAISDGLRLYTRSYQDTVVKAGSMVYLDPPYDGRSHQSKMSAGFDYGEFYDWAEETSRKSTVIVTAFDNPRDYEVLHDYGDTTMRPRSNPRASLKPVGHDRELILLVRPSGVRSCLNQCDATSPSYKDGGLYD